MRYCVVLIFGFVIILWNDRISFGDESPQQSQQALNQSQKRWSLVLANYFGHGFREESKFNSQGQLQGEYQIYGKYLAGLESGYTHVFSKIEGSSSNTQAIDSVVYFKDENVFGKRGSQLNGTLSFRFTFPTSSSSLDAGLRTGYSVEQETESYQKWGKIKFTNEAFFYDYQFQTSNAAGTSYNPQWALMNQLLIAIPVVKRFTWHNTGILLHELNYAGTASTDYRVRTGMMYSFPNQLSLDLRFQNGDRIVENQNAFRFEQSSVSLGVIYEL